MFKGLLIGGVAAAALFAAAPAQADGGSFIQSLSAHGLVIYDQQKAVATGHAICDALKTVSVATEASILYKGTTDFTSITDATTLVTVAAQELCKRQTTTPGMTGQDGKIGGPFRA